MLPGDGKFQPQLTQLEYNGFCDSQVTFAHVSMALSVANGWYQMAFGNLLQLSAAARILEPRIQPTASDLMR